MLPLAAQAHHGLDFLLLQDTSIPSPLSGAFFNNAEWSRENIDDEYSTEPGLYLGVAPGIGLGVTSHFSDSGDGWAYAATTPYVVVNLLPPDIKGFRVALWAGYEFAAKEDAPHSSSTSPSSRSSTKQRKTAKTSSATVSSNSGKSTGSSGSGKKITSPNGPSRHEGGTCNPNAGPDAPPCPGTHNHSTAAPAATKDEPETEEAAPVPVADTSSHTHQGIHRHGESGLHTRLIIEADLSSRNKLVANLINFTPEEGKGAWGYGIGMRHSFTHDLAMSLEAIGDFNADLEHQVVVAAHISPVHWLTFKVGVGVGITPEASDVAVHTGLVWRF